MTKFANSTFSVSSPGTEEYRDGWERTFRKSTTEAAECEGNVCKRSSRSAEGKAASTVERTFTILYGDPACEVCSPKADEGAHWQDGTCGCQCHNLLSND